MSTKPEGQKRIAIERMIGTWRIVGRASYDANGKALPPPHEPKGSHHVDTGLLSINANGRMMAVLCDGRPDVDVSPRDYSSYCGKYTFDGATFVTTVDASPPERIGTKQVRKIRFDGDILVLMPPALPRDDGTVEHREVSWERISYVAG
jgi:hypothetical protein